VPASSSIASGDTVGQTGRDITRERGRGLDALKRRGVEREVSMMDALRAVGLAWIVAAPTVASAQTTAPSALPPLRLPGITYPAPAEARTEPPAPALKQQGAPRQVAVDPPHPLRAGLLAVVNGRDITVATVTVVAETETVRHDEPLAPNAQAVLRLPQMKGCTATVQAVFEGGEVSVIGTIDVCRVKLVRLIE
jgi:hypothetical protein